MNFLEQVFGFAPDGGSGSFEVLLVLVPLVLLYMIRKRVNRAFMR